MKTSIVEQTAGSLAKYVSPSKLKKSFKEIMRITEKKAAKTLAINQGRGGIISFDRDFKKILRVISS